MNMLYTKGVQNGEKIMPLVYFNRTLLGLILMSCLLLTANCSAESNQKQPLSQVLKESLDNDGPAATRQLFNDIYPEEKDNYVIDNNALGQLTRDYAQAGNMDAMRVLTHVMTVITQDMMAEHMADQQETMKKMMAEQQQNQSKKSKNKPQTKPQKHTPRTDLDRFTGLYGDPNKTDSYRQLWVAQSCDGRLVIGATWGDVAPWWMTSESDNQFSYKDSFTNLNFEFNGMKDNQATTLTHDLHGLVSPLQRVGPLTDDYPKCFETPRR